MKLLTVVLLYHSTILINAVQFSRCLNNGHSFYRYSAEQKKKVICYFFQFPIKEVSLNISTENALQRIVLKYKQNNITEAIAPTLEDLRNFHYAALLEYPEYAEGLVGALFGLFFTRENGFVNNDSSGMYGGKMIWYDGTPAKTNFSSFHDPLFNPRVNKSHCYRFMTWATEDNDFKIVAFECKQKVTIYHYLIGFSYLIDLPQKTATQEYDCETKISLANKNLNYPKRCALGDHGWEGTDGEVHCFSIVYKMSNHTEQLYSIDDSICRIQRQRTHIRMYPAVFREKKEYEFIMKKLQDDLKTDQPMFYQYHSVLFGLWYFRGAGYRWSDFSQNSNFGFIDPSFNPRLNTSQCYRFLAIPFGTKYAIPMECSMQLNVLSALCMYKSDQYHPEHHLSKITISNKDNGLTAETMNSKLLAESIGNRAGNQKQWRCILSITLLVTYCLF
ncbi:hypothetical protein ACH3XW_41280 [Acanthocheilonema viteae]